MNADQLCDLDLKGVSEAIQRHEISSLEATKAYLGRIERYDGVLLSYLTVTAELALDQARTADAELAGRQSRGPLHGVPIGLKDEIAWGGGGVRLTGGSRLLADYVPSDRGWPVAGLGTAAKLTAGRIHCQGTLFPQRSRKVVSLVGLRREGPYLMAG